MSSLAGRVQGESPSSQLSFAAAGACLLHVTLPFAAAPLSALCNRMTPFVSTVTVSVSVNFQVHSKVRRGRQRRQSMSSSSILHPWSPVSSLDTALCTTCYHLPTFSPKESL